jgi:hypothetical protein
MFSSPFNSEGFFFVSYPKYTEPEKKLVRETIFSEKIFVPGRVIPLSDSESLVKSEK